jgi:hypothetical protein
MSVAASMAVMQKIGSGPKNSSVGRRRKERPKPEVAGLFVSEAENHQKMRT